MADGIIAPTLEIDEEPRADFARAVIRVMPDGTVEMDVPGTGERPAPPPRQTGFDENLAESMSDNDLAMLASYFLESIAADKNDRNEWEDTATSVAAYLGVNLNEPDSAPSADGTMSNAVATCMLQAAMRMWGTSCGELLPAGGPVKVQRLEPIIPDEPPDGLPPVPAQVPGQDGNQKGDRIAQALERDMNWYLTIGDPGYYPDFRKMLMNRNLIGIAFREVFQCMIERKPLSRWIMAEDFVVNGSPAHLSQAPRIFVRKRVRKSVVRRLQKMGVYRDIELVAPTGQTSRAEIEIGQTEGVAPLPSLPRDYQHVIWEGSVELGEGDEFTEMTDHLSQDETGKNVGYPLPYRVVLDEDSKAILAIHRDWKKGDERRRRRRRYVKYGFLPAYGGKFYDWGLLHVLGNPTQGATMIQRSGIDAAVLANFPAWMVLQSAATRMENTTFRPGPGDMVKIPATAGVKLQDVIQPWPYKEPSAIAMQIGQKLETDASKLAGIVEIPVGEGRVGNTPVGTIMSYVESVSMVPGAVHKADHDSQAEEFSILRELLAENPTVIYRDNPDPARKWQTAEELLSTNVAPRADPNTPSQVHRLMKVQGKIVISGMPQFQGIADQRKIFREAMEALGSGGDMELPEQTASAAPPPPDPKIIAAQIKAQTEASGHQADLQKAQLQHQGRIAEIAAEGQQREADRQSDETRAAMTLQAAKVKAHTDASTATQDRAHDTLNQHADRLQQGQQHADSLQAQRDQALNQSLSGSLTGGMSGGGAGGLSTGTGGGDAA